MAFFFWLHFNSTYFLSLFRKLSILLPYTRRNRPYTGLFEMIVGVLTTCHTQYTWDSSICIFYLIEKTLQVFLHTLQVLYMSTICNSTGLFEMIVGVLTTCHTQYTWGSSICIFYLIEKTLQVLVTYLTGALYVHSLWFYKHQHDNRVRSACQRWWFQWRTTPPSLMNGNAICWINESAWQSFPCLHVTSKILIPN